MGNVHSRSADTSVPAFRGQCLDFIHTEDGRDAAHTSSDVGSLRTAALFLAERSMLSGRLSRLLHETHLEDDTRLHAVISFDDSLEAAELLKCMWVVEHNRWDEAADALRLAGQCGLCSLPAIITRGDLQRHRTKQAFLAEPRVVALWKLVGRHVDLGGGMGRLELFVDGHGSLRAIQDESDFEIELAPDLPADHPFQQHSDPQNPPVRHSITAYDVDTASWVVDQGFELEASFSAFLMALIITAAWAWGSIAKSQWIGRGRSDEVEEDLMDLMRRPVHRPFAEGVTAHMATMTDTDTTQRTVLVTPLGVGGHPFVAGINIQEEDYQVRMQVFTTEPSVGGAADDQHRRLQGFRLQFPQSTALMRPVLHRTGRRVFDSNQGPQTIRMTVSDFGTIKLRMVAYCGAEEGAGRHVTQKQLIDWYMATHINPDSEEALLNEELKLSLVIKRLARRGDLVRTISWSAQEGCKVLFAPNPTLLENQPTQ